MTERPGHHHWRAHPWHGLEVGPRPPEVVTAYIEITTFDDVKYEIDKHSGYLRVDRPQRSSAHPPALYGFIPRTFCGMRVQRLAGVERADGDPLDICIISERPVARADILLSARVVGGLQMVDDGEADDKIVAVLQGDLYWGSASDLADLPERMVERLVHYFSTYKLVPGQASTAAVIRTYDRAHAHRVVEAAMADYAEEFPAAT